MPHGFVYFFIAFVLISISLFLSWHFGAENTANQSFSLQLYLKKIFSGSLTSNLTSTISDQKTVYLSGPQVNRFVKNFLLFLLFFCHHFFCLIRKHRLVFRESSCTLKIDYVTMVQNLHTSWIFLKSTLNNTFPLNWRVNSFLSCHLFNK